MFRIKDFSPDKSMLDIVSFKFLGCFCSSRHFAALILGVVFDSEEQNPKFTYQSNVIQKTQDYAIWNYATARSLAEKYVVYSSETHILILSA